MTTKTWLSGKNLIFFALLFLPFSFSALRGQQISYKSIQSDMLITQPDSSLPIQKQDSLYSISDEDIQKEMRFSTRNKIGSCIGGGILGFLIGAGIGASVSAAIIKPAKDEGLAVLPGSFIGGCLGAVVGGKAMYEIVEHSEKKAAKERLLEKRRSKE